MQHNREDSYKKMGIVDATDVPDWERRTPKWSKMAEEVRELSPGKSIAYFFDSAAEARQARNAVRDNVNLELRRKGKGPEVRTRLKKPHAPAVVLESSKVYDEPNGVVIRVIDSGSLVWVWETEDVNNDTWAAIGPRRPDKYVEWVNTDTLHIALFSAKAKKDIVIFAKPDENAKELGMLEKDTEAWIWELYAEEDVISWAALELNKNGKAGNWVQYDHLTEVPAYKRQTTPAQLYMIRTHSK